MKRYFRFRYFMKRPPFWKMDCDGAVVVEVHTLDDIAGLVGESGCGVTDVTIRTERIETEIDDVVPGMYRTVVKERHFVIGRDMKGRSVCVGTCNFNDGNING